MKPYQFKVGEQVHGKDGRICARVLELVGPYSVFLSDGYVTPVSLLMEPPEPMPWEKPEGKMPWE